MHAEQNKGVQRRELLAGQQEMQVQLEMEETAKLHARPQWHKRAEVVTCRTLQNFSHGKGLTPKNASCKGRVSSTTVAHKS